MIALITLVLPVDGNAGPFNLFSDIDGYTIPFETNVPTSSLVAGYISINVPDGTNVIRVVSTGVCTNYIDIQVNLIPTTTTTSSSTSTTTSTSTTAGPTTTTTSSSSTSTSTSTSTTSTTSTSSTTTTTTTCPCYTWDITGNEPDVTAGLNVSYYKCNGALTVAEGLKVGTVQICVISDGSTPVLYRDDLAPVVSSTVAKTNTCCTTPPYACASYQINPPVNFGDPVHEVEYIECGTNTVNFVTLAYNDFAVNICVLQILSDTDPLLTTLLGPCSAPTTTTTTTGLLSLYYRTQNGQVTPYPGDGCALDLLQSCKVQTQNPNPSIITSGDRVFNDPGSGYFDGEGKEYRIQISTGGSGDPSYHVIINNLGYISLISPCV